MAIKKNLLVFMGLCFVGIAHAEDWRELEPGLAYQNRDFLHAVRIDPHLFKFKVVTAAELGQKSATAKQFARLSQAPLAVNGGFFDPQYQSLGLMIRDGTVLNSLHPTSWWGIFYITEQTPMIVPPKIFRPQDKIEMALQVGPRLVIEGETPKLKPAIARLSGIGIQRDGNIIIAVSDMEMSIQAFAKLFQRPEVEGGFGCLNALNLDGGSSSQLYLHHKNLTANIVGPSNVANAIVVLPR